MTTSQAKVSVPSKQTMAAPVAELPVIEKEEPDVNQFGLTAHYSKKFEREDQDRLATLLKVRPFKVTQNPIGEYSCQSMTYFYDANDELSHLIVEYHDGSTRMVEIPH